MKKKIAFSLIMGILTTGLISFTLISVNIGMIPGFVQVWSKSWALAYAVVVPTILLLGPQVQKIVDSIFNEGT